MSNIIFDKDFNNIYIGKKIIELYHFNFINKFIIISYVLN